MKARAPIEDASGPTWTRTSAKLVLKKDSIFFWIGSGRGWPLPRGLSVKFAGQGKGIRPRAAARRSAAAPAAGSAARRRWLCRSKWLDGTGRAPPGRIGWGTVSLALANGWTAALRGEFVKIGEGELAAAMKRRPVGGCVASRRGRTPE